MGKWDGKRRHTTECIFSGIPVKLTRFNVRDFRDFREWIKERKREAFKKESASYVAHLKACGVEDPLVIIEQLERKLGDIDIAEEAGTVEGLAMIAYLAARHHQPTITPGDIEDLLEVTTDAVEAVLRAALPDEFLTIGKEAPEPEAEKKTEEVG